MTKARLYYSKNLNPRLCVAVARYLGADLHYIHSAQLTAAERAGFDGLNPMGRFPVLQRADGSTLWETDAIICQLSGDLGSNLWRRDASQPEMIRWLSWTAYHLMPAGDVHYFENIVRPTFSDQPEDPGLMARSMADFRSHATVLNDVLAQRMWLVDDDLSYADFRVATLMPFAHAARLPVDDFPHIMRHATQLQALPHWADAFAGLDAGPDAGLHR